MIWSLRRSARRPELSQPDAGCGREKELGGKTAPAEGGQKGRSCWALRHCRARRAGKQGSSAQAQARCRCQVIECKRWPCRCLNSESNFKKVLISWAKNMCYHAWNAHKTAAFPHTFLDQKGAIAGQALLLWRTRRIRALKRQGVCLQCSIPQHARHSFNAPTGFDGGFSTPDFCAEPPPQAARRPYKLALAGLGAGGMSMHHVLCHL